MKKKCTTSTCRKTFYYQKDEFVVCPFCGKEYPRQNGFGGDLICKINGVPYNFNTLKKINPKEVGRLDVIKMVRQITKSNIRTAKYMGYMLYETGQLPAIVTVSGENGRDVKMSGAIRVWKRRT